MTEPLKSRIWRDRAEEYRLFSEEAKSDDARRAYLDVSQSCATIAARLEKLEAAEMTSQRLPGRA